MQHQTVFLNALNLSEKNDSREKSVVEKTPIATNNLESFFSQFDKRKSWWCRTCNVKFRKQALFKRHTC